ncbi:Zerumbone synthase [Armadillidium nasatum]|uniref:15-hydroxyprostaglandin dehydrogenase [NAD(+)] n=1 Tax=Armadillidium nasatum TaxID=96803 RepID=A0A5N5TJ01_9CRUS|nr:Zerumbone synthase [Armadillidium nasatum]
MDFNGKVVLITGGAGGIGKSLARTFLEKGAKVSVCDVNEVEGKLVSEQLEKEFGKNKILFTKCDVTKEEDFERAYNSCESFLGIIDILINNAAVLVNDFRKETEVIQICSD